MSKLVRLWVLACLLSPFVARAENSDETNNREPSAASGWVDPYEGAFPRPPETDLTLKPSEIMKLGIKAEAANKLRSPASNVNDANWSKAMHKIRDRLMALETGDEVGAELDMLEAAYDGKTPYHGIVIKPEDIDAREFIARVMPLRNLAGIIWKMIPIVEQTRLTQEVAVGVLRGMFEQMDIRFPDEQNKAVWAFFTQPYVNSKHPHDLRQFRYEDKSGDQIRKKDDAEDLIARGIAAVYYPGLKKAIERIEKINIPATRPIVLDNRMRWGDTSFVENSESRFTVFGETERLATLARMNRRMFRIAFALAYDFTGFVRYRKELGQAIGLDAIGIGAPRVTGLTRRKQVAIANDVDSYPRLFNLIGGEREKSLLGRNLKGGNPITQEDYNLRRGTGALWMKTAYDHLVKYAIYSHTAWCSIKDDIEKGKDTSNLLDPELFAGRSDEIRIAVHNMTGIVLGDQIVPEKGLPCLNSKSSAATKAKIDKLDAEIKNATASRHTAHSRITGKVVNVNLKTFFMEPPESLRDLMPKFPDNQKDPPNDSKVAVVITRKTADGKVRKISSYYRDYGLGRATEWQADKYRKLFIALDRGSDVDNMFTTLRQTRGGRIATQPFALFVR